LKKAFEITYGVKDIKAGAEFSKYKSILRHDKKMISKTIAYISYLLKNPEKKSRYRQK